MKKQEIYETSIKLLFITVGMACVLVPYVATIFIASRFGEFSPLIVLSIAYTIVGLWFGVTWLISKIYGEEENETKT